ncbi:MAG TPA: hypothetical protein VD994_03380, partial [Prosthecobacter sp.]|nr:hypothetical protein [Prosthecobacter sp.]
SADLQVSAYPIVFGKGAAVHEHFLVKGAIERHRECARAIWCFLTWRGAESYSIARSPFWRQNLGLFLGYGLVFTTIAGSLSGDPKLDSVSIYVRIATLFGFLLMPLLLVSFVKKRNNILFFVHLVGIYIVLTSLTVMVASPLIELGQRRFVKDLQIARILPQGAPILTNYVCRAPFLEIEYARARAIADNDMKTVGRLFERAKGIEFGGFAGGETEARDYVYLHPTIKRKKSLLYQRADYLKKIKKEVEGIDDAFRRRYANSGVALLVVYVASGALTLFLLANIVLSYRRGRLIVLGVVLLSLLLNAAAISAGIWLWARVVYSDYKFDEGLALIESDMLTAGEICPDWPSPPFPLSPRDPRPFG